MSAAQKLSDLMFGYEPEPTDKDLAIERERLLRPADIEARKTWHPVQDEPMPVEPEPDLQTPAGMIQELCQRVKSL